MKIPELGVGLTWFSGMEPLLQANAGLVDVLEIEPQTLLRREPHEKTVVVDTAALEANVNRLVKAGVCSGAAARERGLP